MANALMKNPALQTDTQDPNQTQNTSSVQSQNEAGAGSANKEAGGTAVGYAPEAGAAQDQNKPAHTPKSPENNGITADYIKNFYQQMQDQNKASVDYSVQQAVQELQRAQEEAQNGYQTQRNQVNIDEAQARDAEVLYANARGDRGGITARQYNSIANTAAKNRLAVNEAQQKLATDTARQIADLRAQGEFEKANAVLQIAQQQLAQLWDLQRYEADSARADKQLAMSEANLTGQYGGEKTYAAKEAERAWAYDLAMASIQMGVTPSEDLLAAAGLNAEEAKLMAYIYGQTSGNAMLIEQYKQMQNQTQTQQGGVGTGGFGGGGSYGGGSSGGVSFDPSVDYQALINQAVKNGDLSAAAKFEQQRNAKIDAMNKAGINTEGYEKTDLYSGGPGGSGGSGGGNGGGNGGGGGDGGDGGDGGGDPVVDPNKPALSDTMYNRALAGFADTLKKGDAEAVAEAYNVLERNWNLTEAQRQELQKVITGSAGLPGPVKPSISVPKVPVISNQLK